MHFKLLQSAEPLKAEALLLRGEDVSAANPRERFSSLGVQEGWVFLVSQRSASYV